MTAAALTATRDQLEAAHCHAVHLADDTARAPGITTHPPHGVVDWIVGRWFAVLVDGAAVCGHPGTLWLDLGNPCPILDCTHCAAAAMSDRAGCDRCSAPGPLAGAVLALPGLVGRHRGTHELVSIPPAIALAALCARCWGAP